MIILLLFTYPLLSRASWSAPT
jgi:hypothetical protein